MMAANFLLTVAMVIATDLSRGPWVAVAVPVTYTVEPQLSSSGDVIPEVASSGDIGSDVTQDLREGALVTDLHHLGGCLDNTGEVHLTGTSWNIGCDQTCECVITPEGPIQDCFPPRCAIPMLSPGCQLVRNPQRNDRTGENCCDVVDCKPLHCVDNKGGKHEVYTSWTDGELDCFCQYNYQQDTVEPSCILLQSETSATVPPAPPAPMELRYEEQPVWERESESGVNETNEIVEVCKDKQQNTHSVGQTWRVGCETECVCVQQGEITSAQCSPIPCPVPAILPGCTIVPNPDRDVANSLNCCDKVVCPHKLCIGEDQILRELYSVWTERGQTCTCALNYNVNQAMKKCGTAEEVGYL
ncbi:uncharacterized protein LOC135475491 [Liolophura sinensis]|uniref:uncharacterized protein LOC135475491 n=1 Tax=Liolophura sinensis TaxID=3198878 RepID=UPI0031595297